MKRIRFGSGWRSSGEWLPLRDAALSILDLSPVTTATPPAQALRNTLDLARFADTLGFTRYWLAEHHNLANIASSAPDIMIGQVAAITQNMRIGSGGVMLPNHAPLMVMERFKVLEALFPGRIDLGLGRAPGTDQITSLALRRRQDTSSEQDDFLDRFQEMILFESKGFPPNHPFSKVAAMPTDVPLPPIWLLGSSGYSAELAAHVGAGFSFAHHFSDFPPDGPMLNYRSQFKPSAWRQTPYAILGVAAICAETDAEADHLAKSADLHFARRAVGRIRSARVARRGRRLSLHADRPPAHRAQSQAADRRLARTGARAHRRAGAVHARPTR